MQTLKLALITDIHHGPSEHGKQGDQALSLLEDFVTASNLYKPDLVIDMGDRISDIDKEGDFALEQEVISIFNKLDAPHVHLLGNHDLEHLSREDNEAALGLSVASQSIDLKNHHLIFWQPNARFPEFVATAEQLNWLKDDLASTTLPSLIFTHAPFSDGAMHSHYYFQNAPKSHAGYQNSQAIRQLINNNANVTACLSGHVHWNSLNTINGTHYLTLQSLTESFTTQGQAAQSWAWLELSDKLHLKVEGNDPFEVILPKKVAGTHWRAALPFEA